MSDVATPQRTQARGHRRGGGARQRTLKQIGHSSPSEDAPLRAVESTNCGSGASSLACTHRRTVATVHLVVPHSGSGAGLQANSTGQRHAVSGSRNEARAAARRRERPLQMTRRKAGENGGPAATHTPAEQRRRPRRRERGTQTARCRGAHRTGARPRRRREGLVRAVRAPNT